MIQKILKRAIKPIITLALFSVCSFSIASAGPVGMIKFDEGSCNFGARDQGSNCSKAEVECAERNTRIKPEFWWTFQGGSLRQCGIEKCLSYGEFPYSMRVCISVRGLILSPSEQREVVPHLH